MRSRCFPIVLLLCAAGALSAGPIIYDITVDTSSVSGDAGSLDFQFNPGPFITQAASLQILNFASDGTLAGSPTLTGDVSGALSGPLTFDNGTPYNDYFEDLSFGSTLSFQVSLFGSALSSPDGTSTSTSAFAFSMFSDAAGTIPILTSDTTDGFASVLTVNLDGTTTPSNFSDQTSVFPAESAVPEPALFRILVLMLVMVVLRQVFSRVRRFL